MELPDAQMPLSTDWVRCVWGGVDIGGKCPTPQTRKNIVSIENMKKNQQMHGINTNYQIETFQY